MCKIYTRTAFFGVFLSLQPGYIHPFEDMAVLASFNRDQQPVIIDIIEIVPAHILSLKR